MSPNRRTLSLGFLAAAFAFGATAQAATYTVQIGAGGTKFTPPVLTIAVGDTIHWVWAGSPHSTTSGTCSSMSSCTADGTWDSGVQSIGATFDQTFSSAGTFPYYCRIHLGMMTGTITVETAAQFNTVTPCRVADTRGATGSYGAPSLAAGADRTFIIAGQCGVPSNASSVSFNFTVTRDTADGDLRVIPAGQTLPTVSTLNWRVGQTRANNAVVGLGASGDILVHLDQSSGTADLVIDVNGYFQ